jgi:hypothetical protein
MPRFATIFARPLVKLTIGQAEWLDANKRRWVGVLASSRQGNDQGVSGGFEP